MEAFEEAEGLVDERKACFVQEDCVPVGCEITCHEVKAFDVVNVMHEKQWYEDAGCPRPWDVEGAADGGYFFPDDLVPGNLLSTCNLRICYDCVEGVCVGSIVEDQELS